MSDISSENNTLQKAALRAQDAMQKTSSQLNKSMPIEKDPRFKKLLKEYKYKCDCARAQNTFMVSAVASVITSPLIVVGMSMQMSVMPNITIYGDVKPSDINKGLLSDKIGLGQITNRKAIATSEKMLAEYKGGSNIIANAPEPRSDLIKASGQVGFNKPFRAPVYRTYYECIQGLYKQGILAFYKGNGLRLLYVYGFMRIQTDLNNEYLDGDDAAKVKSSYLKNFGSMLVAGSALHFLHIAETRYVLQNRLPNFQSYPSFFNFFKDSMLRTGGELQNGLPGYIPIFGLLALTNYQMFGSTSLTNIVIQGSVIHSLAYPFLTAQRRMEAQSPMKAGMLHPRYNNYLSCLFHMYKEEGLKGFYRGYLPHMAAQAILLMVVPLFSQMLLEKSPLYGKSKSEQNEQLYDEVTERKERIEKLRKKQKKEERDSRDA